VAALQVHLVEGLIDRVFIVVNPEKLAGLGSDHQLSRR
jgi:hypothetical protein